MYRILEDATGVRERRNQLRHPAYTAPQLLATRPNEVWSWDITRLLGPEKWTYYYLYVILDIFSRYVVGWMLAHRESADLASRLLRESLSNQGVSPGELIVHSDRGPSMTSHNVAQLLAQLGVVKSHSRPHVSNDNPFSESQFKTMKYRPEFPARFGGYEDALSFCRDFFTWYNEEHYHEGVGMLTPATVHYGQAEQVLAARHEVLQAAYAKHPERFVRGCPQRQQPPVAVWINPPERTAADDKKRPPATNCPRRPEASLTHPRPGYPLASCVPAELASVSPGTLETNARPAVLQPPLNTRAMPEKIPGVRGLAPGAAVQKPTTETTLH
jgi:putative transposase